MSLDRRQLLKRLSLLLGGAVSAPVATGLLAGCRPRAVAPENRILDTRARETAGLLAERILPRTDTPGALDAAVDGFIEAMLADYVPEEDRQIYVDGLARLEQRAQERWGAGFADCSEPEQVELVAELDHATFAPDDEVEGIEETDRRFYRLHKELTVSGYYTSEVGQTQELELMPLGEYRADVPIGPDQKAWA